MFEALQRFGAPLEQHGVTPGLFAREEYGYRIGIKPVLIEILTTIDGVDFDRASENKVFARVAGRDVPFIGREALIANKQAAGRAKDLADVEGLKGERDT